MKTLPVLLLLASAALGDDVRETSYRLTTGERVLRHEAIVKAPAQKVFDAFTTAEGLRGFAAPVVAIDLRIGGRWEASHDVNKEIGDPGNIHNEILSYVPGRMLSIRIKETPAGFPHAAIAKSVWTVILFEDRGDGTTRVETSMLPWKQGDGWDQLYKFFQAGNASILRNLQALFTTGPVAWPAPAREQHRKD